MPDLRSEIDRLRDLLAEAKRYVRSDPEEARRLVGQVMCELDRGWGPDSDMDAISLYLTWNLRDGLRYLNAAPHVLEGYIDGASYKLLCMVGRIRG